MQSAAASSQSFGNLAFAVLNYYWFFIAQVLLSLTRATHRGVSYWFPGEGKVAAFAFFFVV